MLRCRKSDQRYQNLSTVVHHGCHSLSPYSCHVTATLLPPAWLHFMQPITSGCRTATHEAVHRSCWTAVQSQVHKAWRHWYRWCKGEHCTGSKWWYMQSRKWMWDSTLKLKNTIRNQKPLQTFIHLWTKHNTWQWSISHTVCQSTYSMALHELTWVHKMSWNYHGTHQYASEEAARLTAKKLCPTRR